MSNRQRNRDKVWNKAEFVVKMGSSHHYTVCASRRNTCLYNKDSILLVTIIVLLLPKVVVSTVYYPPFFNAALGKPVTLTPAEEICGEGRPAKFCKSMTDRQSVLSCWQQDCGISCPQGRFQLPVWEDAFNRVILPWPNCVTQNATFGPPPQAHKTPAAYSAYFPGEISGQNCFLKLDPTWMLQIRLMEKWSLTVSVWMYNMLDSTQTGTIFDISDGDENPLLRLLLQGEQLKVQGGSPMVTREEPSWLVPRRTWLHVLVRFYVDSVEVFFNGDHVHPSVYNMPMTGPKSAALFRVGYSEIGYYVGYLRDFQIYMQAVSNREVKEIMTGVIPEIRVQSECRCPVSHPRMKDNDMNYCVQNDGVGKQDTEEYRLNKEAYLLEFVNDGKPDTFWISKPIDSSPGSIQESIEIDLLDVFEVRRVDILFYSPFPNVVIIERKQNASSNWTPWKYYSQSCAVETGYPQEEPLGESASAINCQYLVQPGDAIPYSMGRVTFDLLAGRKGHENEAPDTFTDELRQFLQASSVRVTIRGYPFTRNDMHKYHSISELLINGTCNCHGHASSCAISEYPYECECAGATYTEGRLCDRCQKGAFLDPNKNPYSADLCGLCNCSPEGTVNGSMACDEVGGQCDCKANATGRQCDTCVPGFYNLAASNENGCEICTCDGNGTVNGSNICDVSSGQCPCKDNVNGKDCNLCKDGFFNLDGNNPKGCNECSCNIKGTEDGSEKNCDTSGQCECKANVRERSCGTCADGYYDLELKNPSGCKDCLCDNYGSVNSSCDATTGQCICKRNVEGRQCNVCSKGYYALNADDLAANGCSHECACSADGTKPGTEGQCFGVYGGQCTCRLNVEGRACDTCKRATYKFGTSFEGCVKCDCYEAGSQVSDCHNQTGQCNCKTNVHQRQCDACKPEYYDLDIGNDLGCTSCACNILGSESNVCTNTTGQCPCYLGAGDPEKAGRQCVPHLDMVDPVYGPESGGTKVTLTGGYFGNDTSNRVSVGGVDCMVDQYTSTMSRLVCLTASLESVGRMAELEIPQSIVLYLADGSIFNASESFTYRKDPEIDSVEPLRTFLEGGIELTVLGKDLSSVAYPILEVTMVYTVDESTYDSATFQSPCEHMGDDGTIMSCPTPNITLPDDVVSRMKRDLRGAHPRVKRQTTIEKKLNNDRLNFYLGFRLDGVMLYKNMSEANPLYSIIDVYVNPELRKFEEDGHIRMYRPYWPYTDKYLTIKGDNLDYGAGSGDYQVMVGDVDCEVQELSSNQILCMPPVSMPSVSEYNHKNGIPHVEVTVGNIVFLAGYLDYEDTFWDNTSFRWGVIGGCIGFLLLVIILVVCCCCCCRTKTEPDDGFDHPHKKYPKLEMSENGRPGNAYIHGYNGSTTGSYLNPEMTMDVHDILPRDLRLRVDECTLDYKRMVVGKIIGEGHYGRVHIGRLHNENLTQTSAVAIKTLKENTTNHNEIIQFLEEATMMKDFRHENVLSLIGVVFENDRAFVILPMMENGDLKSYISNEENLLTVGELIDFGLQAAKGMNYLSEQRFVHRDLACRNCMIDKNLNVRVADFGLSRDIYSAEYYRVSENKRPLPVKWLALESLEAGVFTTKSDVWSFGVLLWELLTRGCTPYPDVESYELRTYLSVGSRMDRPDYSPDEMYVLMISCWDETPGRRPTFYDIILRISDFLEISNSKTVMRDHQSQHIPTVAYRGRSYLSLLGH